MHTPVRIDRRTLLAISGGMAAYWATPGLFAEELGLTPQMAEGPFYPDKLPLDTDNDLILLNDSTTPAVGEITHLSGRVLTKSGAPVRNAFVEIWQVDHHGVYLHTGSANNAKRDSNFQGYGRFLTDSKGRYYFRTVKPVPYPGRTPHIHVAVSRNGRRIFTSQLLIEGHPMNAGDGLVRAIKDTKALKRLVSPFKPIADSKIGELAAEFDVVLGLTPEELDSEAVRGGIAQPQWRRRSG